MRKSLIIRLPDTTMQATQYKISPVAPDDESAMHAHILNVEDEQSIRDMVRFALERHGHTVYSAATAGEARKLMADQRMDLAIIDWMLPGGSGIELVKSMRKDELHANLPIIMLTARTDEHDITTGLDAGADDYVTKPFSPRELQSRIKALLRRSNALLGDSELQRGMLSLNLGAHRITVANQEIDLGHTEFKLLAFFMEHPDRVYSRAQLLDHVWGPGTFIEERTVDVHILRLRKSLKPHGADGMLETVRGAGYRFSG